MPFTYWGTSIWIDPNDSLVSTKCPSTASGTLTISLKYKSTFQPTMCAVTAQNANLTGVPVCLCTAGLCQVTGLKVVNTFWAGDVAGSDTTMSAGLTYNVGDANKNSDTKSVDILFTSGTWNPLCIATSISSWYDTSVAVSVRTGTSGATQAADGNPVSVLIDQSSNGRNATRTTVADQPLYRANANSSGYPGVQFISNDYFDLPSTVLSGASANFIFIVSQNNSSGSWARYFDFGSSTNSNYFSTPTNGANSRLRITTSGGGGEQGVADGTAVNNNRTIMMFQHTGSAISIFRDGATTGTANVATSILPSTVGNTQNYIGKSQYAADPYFLGWMQEILIVNTTATAAERIILEGYLASKWGLQSVLPAAHKYKTSPP